MVSSLVRIAGGLRLMHGQFADRAAVPAQHQPSLPAGVIAVQGDVDLLEQRAQQLLAVAVGGAGRGPHLFQVVA